MQSCNQSHRRAVARTDLWLPQLHNANVDEPFAKLLVPSYYHNQFVSTTFYWLFIRDYAHNKHPLIQILFL
ncbi:hypothetical protein GALMADRAFT_244694 [Galerina marginata CBS 339.88]|uniref:Uncharacterized protein n=1 Tax=Galerina marginata (strain CBS 339.88) TaxID=685588 RepID=A0A067TGG6_GALM3|nr:hypothetical protein GALMADRAFT_244694 [Galerina marginata CBS 339.88]